MKLEFLILSDLMTLSNPNESLLCSAILKYYALLFLNKIITTIIILIMIINN